MEWRRQSHFPLFSEELLSIILELPYSRMMEEEADLVGLDLAAKACYDVR